MLKKTFTLTELIIVIVVIAILAAIVIPNVSSFKEEANVSAIKSNVRNLQTAIDHYRLNNEGALPTSAVPTIGNPQYIDYKKLDQTFLRKTPATKGARYWVDYNGTVYGSTVNLPNVTDKDESKGHISWDKSLNTKEYDVFKKKVEHLTLIKQGITNSEYTTGASEDLYVSGKDKYGLETPAVGDNLTLVDGESGPPTENASKFKNGIEVGDYVALGQLDGRPIRWKVIKGTDQGLILFNYEASPTNDYYFNSGYTQEEESQFEQVNWDGSKDRQYLNGPFLNRAFTSTQLSYLKPYTRSVWVVGDEASNAPKGNIQVNLPSDNYNDEMLDYSGGGVKYAVKDYIPYHYDLYSYPISTYREIMGYDEYPCYFNCQKTKLAREQALKSRTDTANGVAYGDYYQKEYTDYVGLPNFEIAKEILFDKYSFMEAVDNPLSEYEDVRYIKPIRVESSNSLTFKLETPLNKNSRSAFAIYDQYGSGIGESYNPYISPIVHLSGDALPHEGDGQKENPYNFNESTKVQWKEVSYTVPDIVLNGYEEIYLDDTLNLPKYTKGGDVTLDIEANEENPALLLYVNPSDSIDNYSRDPITSTLKNVKIPIGTLDMPAYYEFVEKSDAQSCAEGYTWSCRDEWDETPKEEVFSQSIDSGNGILEAFIESLGGTIRIKNIKVRYFE